MPTPMTPSATSLPILCDTCGAVAAEGRCRECQDEYRAWHSEQRLLRQWQPPIGTSVWMQQRERP